MSLLLHIDDVEFADGAEFIAAFVVIPLIILTTPEVYTLLFLSVD